MLPLVGSIDRSFEQFDFHFGPFGRITLDLFVQLPYTTHHVTFNTGGNTGKQFGRRRAEDDETTDHYFESRSTQLLFDPCDDPGALRPQKMRELRLRETPAKAV